MANYFRNHITGAARRNRGEPEKQMELSLAIVGTNPFLDRFINNDNGRLRYKDIMAEDCTEKFQCEQMPEDEDPA